MAVVTVGPAAAIIRRFAYAPKALGLLAVESLALGDQPSQTFISVPEKDSRGVSPD